MIMGTQHRILNRIVTALLMMGLFSLPLEAANESRVNRLLLELQEAEPAAAARIAKEIELEWSQSGSAAMDLLLKRGRDALEAGDVQAAIGHLTALTDHAPEFSEGWHTRAIAYASSGLYGPALEDLERALSLNPQNYNTMTSLGAVLMEVNRPEMAHEIFTKVLTIYPHHEDIQQALEQLEGQIGAEDL